MSNKKQSSIEWLVEELQKFYEKPWKYDKKEIIKQAKAMHRKDIKNSFFAGQCNESERHPFKGSEQYYNETFGGDNE